MEMEEILKLTDGEVRDKVTEYDHDVQLDNWVKFHWADDLLEAVCLDDNAALLSLDEVEISEIGSSIRGDLSGRVKTPGGVLVDRIAPEALWPLEDVVPAARDKPVRLKPS